MNDPRVFFQVAASLIPALIFGGLISDKFRPPKGFKFDSWRGAVVVPMAGLVIIAVFWAELNAIDAGLTGGATRQQTWLVSGVLVLATAGTAIALVWPWIAPLVPDPSAGRTAVTALALLSLAVTVIVGATNLTHTVAAEQRQEAMNERRQADLDSLASLRRSSAPVATNVTNALTADIRLRMADGLIPRKRGLHDQVCLADLILRDSEDLFATGFTSKTPPHWVPGKRTSCSVFLPPV